MKKYKQEVTDSPAAAASQIRLDAVTAAAFRRTGLQFPHEERKKKKKKDKEKKKVANMFPLVEQSAVGVG